MVSLKITGVRMVAIVGCVVPATSLESTVDKQSFFNLLPHLITHNKVSFDFHFFGQLLQLKYEEFPFFYFISF